MAEHSRMMNFHSSILQVASIIKNNEQKKSAENSDIEKKKRERRANYTQEETDRLIDLIIPKKDILENKKGGADQWQEKKQMWEEIEKEFNKNKNITNYRDSKTLRLKYESLRKDVKKKWSNIMVRNSDSNEKLPKLSTAEKKMMEILQLPLEEGFCDFSAVDDTCEDDDSDESRSSDKNEQTGSLRYEFIEKKIGHSDDDDESDESNNELQKKGPPRKKVCRDPLTDKSVTEKQNIIDKKLEIEKLETMKMKKELINKEIQEKELKIKMIQEEIEQSKVIFELQKKRLLMEIEILEKGGSDRDDMDI